MELGNRYKYFKRSNDDEALCKHKTIVGVQEKLNFKKKTNVFLYDKKFSEIKAIRYFYFLPKCNFPNKHIHIAKSYNQTNLNF